MWFYNRNFWRMDITKFHKVLYKYDQKKYYLYFDFSISTFKKQKRKTRKFNFSETLLKFMSQNPSKSIYITRTKFERWGFNILWDTIFLNIDEFQRFCFWLEPRIDRANAFFRQDISIENINLIWATQEQVLEWIRDLSEEKQKDFTDKIHKNILIVDIKDSELLDEVKKRKIGLETFINIIEISKLQEINEIWDRMNLKRINYALDFWEEHKKSSKEIQDWQPFFKENFWVISQIFSSSVSFFDDEFYAWWLIQWKTKWWKWVDFVWKNEGADNISLIEIKTPTSKLIDNKEYWNRVWIYAMHADLMWAISQVLDQKDKTIKEYSNNSWEKNYKVFNPKTILIIGSLENEKMNLKQKGCFELFRNSQKDIDIITYNELFDKIKSLKDLLT